LIVIWGTEDISNKSKKIGDVKRNVQLSVMLMMTLMLFPSLNAKNEAYVSDTFKTKHNREVKITFIKHGSLQIAYDNFLIQVDPVSMFADYSTFPKADVILITHEHEDHLYISPQKNRAVKNRSYFYNCYGKEKEYYIENQG